jgi:hypothetical protein
VEEPSLKRNGDKKRPFSILDQNISRYPQELYIHAGTSLSTRLFDVDRVWKLMDGAIDVHIHSAPDAYAPRLADEVELGIKACEAGLKAVVFKCHSAPNARSIPVVQSAVDVWASEHEKQRTEVFGGVVLNYAVGGLNPEAVAVNARFGGKYVWTPNLDSANHRKIVGLKAGINVIGNDGKVVPEMREIFRLIAEADMVLGICHLTAAEVFALIKEAHDAQVKRIEIVHPNHPSFRLSHENLATAVDMGVFLGLYSWNVAPPMFDLDYYLSVIKRVGVDYVVFGSDCGHFKNVPPTESLRMFITALLLAGVPDKDVERIVRINPSRLLGYRAEP